MSMRQRDIVRYLWQSTGQSTDRTRCLYLEAVKRGFVINGNATSDLLKYASSLITHGKMKGWIEKPLRTEVPDAIRDWVEAANREHFAQLLNEALRLAPRPELRSTLTAMISCV
jgi:hypothetical protein